MNTTTTTNRNAVFQISTKGPRALAAVASVVISLGLLQTVAAAFAPAAIGAAASTAQAAAAPRA